MIGPYQVLPLQVRVGLGAMAMKGWSQSSTITGTSPSDCLGSYLGHSLGVGWSYLFAEVQSVYSTINLGMVTYLEGEFWLQTSETDKKVTLCHILWRCWINLDKSICKKNIYLCTFAYFRLLIFKYLILTIFIV